MTNNRTRKHNSGWGLAKGRKSSSNKDHTSQSVKNISNRDGDTARVRGKEREGKQEHQGGNIGQKVVHENRVNLRRKAQQTSPKEFRFLQKQPSITSILLTPRPSSSITAATAPLVKAFVSPSSFMKAIVASAVVCSTRTRLANDPKKLSSLPPLTPSSSGKSPEKISVDPEKRN